MNAPLPASPHSRGFTLIELLTVIAIIGILAAILIPVVGRVRESARGAQCTSNLREWHAAWMMWSIDNEDLVIPGNSPIRPDGKPGTNHWPGPLGLYAGHTFRPHYVFLDGRDDTIGTCPSSSPDDSTAGHWANNQNDDKRHVAYGYNHNALGTFFSAGWGTTGPKEHRLAKPLGPYVLRMHMVKGNTIVFGDATNWHLGIYPQKPGGGQPFDPISFRHNGRANFVMAGGAVFSESEVPDERFWFYGD